MSYGLTYSYPQKVKYSFDNIYWPNSYNASSISFFLLSNNQLTSKATAADLSSYFLNFKWKYGKLMISC